MPRWSAVALVTAGLLFATGGAQAARRPVPALRHIVVIVFENHEVDAVLGSSQAPTFNAMAKRYATITQYYGISHPSLPNYLALVSGSTWGITNDCTDCFVSATNLADTLARKHKTWKLYAESIYHAGTPDMLGGGNPFVYFDDVAKSSARLRHRPVCAARRGPPRP